MEATSLLLSLLTSTFLFLSCFTLLIQIYNLLLWLAIPIMQFQARAHFSWRPNSLFLERNSSSLIFCDAETCVAKYEGDQLERVRCVFCLCDVEEGEEIRELQCRHVFHRACLDGWMERGGATCPLCRGLLVSEKMKVNLEEMEDEDLENSDVRLLAYIQNAWLVW